MLLLQTENISPEKLVKKQVVDKDASVSRGNHRQKAFSTIHFPLLLSSEESYSVAVPHRDQSLSRGVGGCQLIMKLSIEDLCLCAVLITLAVLSTT